MFPERTREGRGGSRSAPARARGDRCAADDTRRRARVGRATGVTSPIRPAPRRLEQPIAGASGREPDCGVQRRGHRRDEGRIRRPNAGRIPTANHHRHRGVHARVLGRTSRALALRRRRRSAAAAGGASADRPGHDGDARAARSAARYRRHGHRRRRHRRRLRDLDRARVCRFRRPASASRGAGAAHRGGRTRDRAHACLAAARLAATPGSTCWGFNRSKWCGCWSSFLSPPTSRDGGSSCASSPRIMARRRGIRRWVRLPRWKDVRPLAVSITALLALFFLQRDLGPALVLSCVFLGLYGISRARVGLVVGGIRGADGRVCRGLRARRAVDRHAPGGHRARPLGERAARRRSDRARVVGALERRRLGVGTGRRRTAAHSCRPYRSGHGRAWRRTRLHRLCDALRRSSPFSCGGCCASPCALPATTPRSSRSASRWRSPSRALVIVAGMLGLLPLAGVVTPFLSYGRSAMLSNFAALGVCAAIARRRGPARDALTAADACARLVVGGGRAADRRSRRRRAGGPRRHVRDARQPHATGRRRLSLSIQPAAVERRPIDRQRARFSIATACRSRPAARRDREVCRRSTRSSASNCPHDVPRASGERCYPLGGLAFHVLGDATRQTNWAARNTSYVEQDFDARLKGFDDRAHTVEVLNRRAGTTHAVIRRDYSELLPLVRHKGRPAHADVRRILERDRSLRVDDRRRAAGAHGASAARSSRACALRARARLS